MKWKVVVCLLALFSVSAMASAQEEGGSKLDVFVGYSYLRDNPSTSGVNGFNLHGGSASASARAFLTGGMRASLRLHKRSSVSRTRVAAVSAFPAQATRSLHPSVAALT